MIQIKRAYDPASEQDGQRILVDRLWPRCVSKGDAKLDSWEKELAPSTELRKWFGHDPAKWPEFVKRYRKELERQSSALRQIAADSTHMTVTLVYGARDELHNEAVVLMEVIRELGG